MKISNGSILELLLGIFFLYVGFNIENLFTSAIVILISIIVIIWTLYLILNKTKKNSANGKSNFEKKRMCKMYINIFLVVSLILNIVLITLSISLYRNNNKNIKRINYCKIYLKELKYKEHINYNITTNPTIITKYYEINSFNESTYQKAKKCYDNLNVKFQIKKN